MPAQAIKNFAKQSGKSQATIEKYWNKAKKLAKEEGHEGEYNYIIGIVKRMAGISDSFEYEPFFREKYRK